MLDLRQLSSANRIPMRAARSWGWAAARHLAWVSCLALACDAEPDHDAANACDEAAVVIEECGGEPPLPPVEGCVGSFSEAAQEVVESGCAALDGSDGKSDSFWCSSLTSFLGLCSQVPLAEVAALPGLDDACPAARTDALCDALRAGDDAGARDAAAAAIASNPREQVLVDAAVKYWLRERTMALLIWNIAESTGADPASISERALAQLFPIYEPDSFPMATDPLPPDTATCSAEVSAAVLVFPGVVRLGDRNEFSEQRAAVEEALPCVRTYLVESGSFVEPSVNAERGRVMFDRASDELGDVPIHLVGYSQGASNALTSLVEYPALALQTSSTLVMNSAAHGTEVVDALGGLIAAFDGTFCESLPFYARPACEWAEEQSPVPGEFLLRALSRGLGVPVDSIEAFIAAEDSVATAPTLREFFRAHTPGVMSLATEVAAEFWRDSGDDLPLDVVYTSFRSVISDRSENLPLSNALSFSMLERAGENAPYNDMQVRLENQRLGENVSEVEVVGPVAEGNHWQWQLATGEVSPEVMPPEMTEKIPHREYLVAYFQTLAEVGLLTSPKR